MNRILLVDDDAELVSMLKDYLTEEGFSVDVADDGELGLALACSGNYAIAVLDVMLPQMSGIELLNRIRSSSRMPVLMLTARGDDIDRIVGLEQGADDYVPKPCTAREITARIRAILRRTNTEQTLDQGPLQAGALVMWPDRRQASWHAKPLELTSTEFNLLAVLVRNYGQTVSKASLSEQALGRPLQKFDRAIEVHMSKIREKLGLLEDGRSVIQTVFR